MDRQRLLEIVKILKEENERNTNFKIDKNGNLLEKGTDDELWDAILEYIRSCYPPGYCGWDLFDECIEDLGITKEEFFEMKKRLPKIFFVSDNNEMIKVKFSYNLQKIDGRLMCNLFGMENVDYYEGYVEAEISEKYCFFNMVYKYDKWIKIHEPINLVEEYEEYRNKKVENEMERESIDIKRLRKIAKNAINNSDYKEITKNEKKLSKLSEEKLWGMIFLFVIDSIERCDLEPEEIFERLGVNEKEISIIKENFPEYFYEKFYK